MISLLCIVMLGASPVHSAAGPRVDPVRVVNVTLPNAQALDAIIKGGYDVSSVHGNRVTLYATDAEIEQLWSEGYAPAAVPQNIEKAYHSYSDIAQTLQSTASAHSDICRVEQIGESVKGRGLWAILVTKNPDVEEDEPELKYIGAIHGDEPIAVEMCLDFLNLLTANYGTDARITTLVDTTAIWILPSMNPDGLEAVTRYNAHGIDLNRSFPSYPDAFTGTVFDAAPPNYDALEPEVAAVIRWTLANSFTLSANFHSGDLLVNYPYDDDSLPAGTDAPTPDDALFQNISRRYSIHNSPMWNSTDFKDGISNGNAWYTVIGGMQDWNYRYAACNEVTIELSTTKKPSLSALSTLWTDNEESMLSYAESCHIGARGIVLDAGTNAPLWTEVRVEGNDHPVFTDPDVGDYHRMLLPGTYTLKFAAPGYFTRAVENVQVGADEATRVDIALATPDVNRDGAVDAADVQLVINTVLGSEHGYACDFDGGGIGATDLQLLINVILGRTQVGG